MWLSVVQSLGLGVALPALLGWVGLHIRNAVLRQTVNMALERAAGIAYDYLVSRSKGMDPALAKRQAISAGAEYLAATVPDALRSLGVETSALPEMTKAQLGTLLAGDPTVTAGPAVAASSPVPPAPPPVAS